MKVIKRNGLEEPLTKKKIYDSIVKANECVEKENQLTQKQIKRITDAVFEACQDFEEPIPIDKIEDMIEKKLMEASGYEVAKKYITYRYEKERVRRNQHLTEKLMAANVVNQNANVDEFSFGGRIGEAASFIMREYALNNLLSPMAKNNHLNNEIYIHDLDHYAVGDHNCLSIPFDKLLANGFNTRQADIRPASSINTAMQLVAVIFQLQSLQQFGGVAATHLDWTMVPYIRKSFKKYFLEGLKYINEAGESTIAEIKNKLDSYVETNKCLINIGAPTVSSIDNQVYGDVNSKVYRYALEKTTKELEQAIEGMYHNLNTLQSRSGNQLPFTSINYGTCTLPEGRMAIKALLDESINGVGKFHKTSIFPCGIFQIKKGINLYKDDPNHDLFLLALKSTSTRLYPNYANVDWSNNAGYDENDPRTYFSTMGCLDYNETLTIKSGKNTYNYTKHNIKIGDLYEHIKNGNKPCSYKDQKIQNRAKYISNVEDREKFLKNGYILYSGNHFNQWAINFANTYNRKPTILDFKDYVGIKWDRNSVMASRGANMSLVSKWDSYLELKVCDVLNDNNCVQKFFITECNNTFDYIRNKIVTCLDGSKKQIDIYFPNLNIGFEVNDFYTHSKNSDTEQYVTEGNIKCHENDYNGFKKGPTYSKNKINEINKLGIKVIEIWEDEIRDLSFIEILNKELHTNFKINNKQLKNIKTNIETAVTDCIDLEKMGLNKFVKDIDGSYTKIKRILRNSNVSNWVKITTNNRSILVTTDHPLLIESGQILAGELVVGDYLLTDNNKHETIIKIEYSNNINYSYDIETETNSFVFSGIQSHNCRTANGADINAEPGQNIQMKDGRGNICPVTIIMPTLAMQVHQNLMEELKRDNEKNIDWEAGIFAQRCIEDFMKLLDKKIHEAKDMLLERFDWICSQPAKSAKFMYENGTMIGYHSEEGIRSALKHGTLVIGQLGLAETLQILIGIDQTTVYGMKLAKQIEQLFKDRCAEFKKQYKLNFGVYLTPAENLCKTAMSRFKEKYGEIENVSDKKYFTNSTHVPVWKKMTPFKKIDIESELACYSNAGCITYVELDAGTIHNIEALEKLVVYAMEKDLPYFAINVPSDTCIKCGYQGVINDTCPQCGSENIQRLRRVTGYLTGDYKTAFNEGKQQEVEMRVKHNGVQVTE